jgi:predicted DNA-binding protein (UPF0251 family)
MIEQVDIPLEVVGRESPAPEEWRVIPGSEGYYSVSSLGRVRSEPVQTGRAGRQRGRILKCYPDNKGYPQFSMCLPGGRRRTTKVHRVVALAFLGPRPAGAQINHKSGDKNDNWVTNLEYVSCRRNVRHAWETGLRTPEQVQGERHGRSKLTAEKVRLIRSSYGQVTAKELAQRLGVTQQCVNAVLKRKTWRHVA